MRMTEKEIAEAYKRDSQLEGFTTKAFLQNYARLNDCMPSEIKEILENQDVKLPKMKPLSEAETSAEKPKRGRPSMTDDEKLKSKLNNAAKTIKELREIPSSVEVLVSERIEVLNNSIEAHQKMILKNKSEIAELEAFLNGRKVRDM